MTNLRLYEDSLIELPKLKAERDRLAAENKRLREALLKAGHGIGCRVNAFGDVCTCGLDAALKEKS